MRILLDRSRVCVIRFAVIYQKVDHPVYTPWSLAILLSTGASSVMAVAEVRIAACCT